MMYQLSSEAANQGVTTVISLMALLSMNLGIVNLLPIPALDGGKLVLNIFEGIRGKPLSQKKRRNIDISWLWIFNVVDGASYMERYSTILFLEKVDK